MTRLDTYLGWLSFAFVCVAVLVAPWFFGAWEMWWFWPFVASIFAAAFIFFVRAAMDSVEFQSLRLSWPLSARAAAGAGALFLGYALARTLQADVYMTAERSFLLFLTPALLATVLLRGQNREQLNLLYRLLGINLCVLACYGMLNHFATGSRKVMWVVSQYYQYDGRATGPYFCPDHFSGVMELLLGLSLGLMLGVKQKHSHHDPLSRSKNRKALRIVGAAVAFVALRVIWLTHSRGGGLTVLVMLACAAAWRTAGLPARARWKWRAALFAAGIAAIAAFCWSGSAYLQRFKEYVSLNKLRNGTPAEITASMRTTISNDSRYNMYSGAARAWLTRPWFGIGAGMHQHLWPHFAASPDGDRERGIRPTRLNVDTYSYETHNDWLQLLEEYGVVGFLLFGTAAVSLLALLAGPAARGRADAILLGGALSLVSMMFHSLGDFNLQIPATTWMLAAILSIAAAQVLREDA